MTEISESAGTSARTARGNPTNASLEKRMRSMVEEAC